jgi:hypothetical protein
MTTTYGVTTRAMCVECDDQQVVIRGLWWVKRRIPTDRIVAVTTYPSVIYCSPRGRIRRKRIGFFAPNRYADPSRDMRHQMLDHITRLILNSSSRAGRKLRHLDHDTLLDHRRVAEAGARWAGRHPTADRRSLGTYWATQRQRLDTEIARRAEAASPYPAGNHE